MLARAAYVQLGPKKVSFGAVALSSDSRILAVADVRGVEQTSIYIRHATGVYVSFGSKLVGTGAVGKAQQGSSVALSADNSTLAIGGPHDNNDCGEVWIFKRDATGMFVQLGRKLVGNGTIGLAQQGTSVSRRRPVGRRQGPRRWRAAR